MNYIHGWIFLLAVPVTPGKRPGQYNEATHLKVGSFCSRPSAASPRVRDPFLGSDQPWKRVTDVSGPDGVASSCVDVAMDLPGWLIADSLDEVFRMDRSQPMAGDDSAAAETLTSRGPIQELTSIECRYSWRRGVSVVIYESEVFQELPRRRQSPRTVAYTDAGGYETLGWCRCLPLSWARCGFMHPPSDSASFDGRSIYGKLHPRRRRFGNTSKAVAASGTSVVGLDSRAARRARIARRLLTPRGLVGMKLKLNP